MKKPAAPRLFVTKKLKAGTAVTFVFDEALSKAHNPGGYNAFEYGPQHGFFQSRTGDIVTVKFVYPDYPSNTARIDLVTGVDIEANIVCGSVSLCQIPEVRLKEWEAFRSPQQRRSSPKQAGVSFAPPVDLSGVDPDAVPTGALAERAMLVDLTIHFWGATIQDKAVSKEIADIHGSEVSMGRFNKDLLCPEHLAALSTKAGRLRSVHNTYTLPWDDKGRRILATGAYSKYQEEIRAAKNDFIQEFETVFIPSYPANVAEAKRKLNGLAKDLEYPSVEHLRRKFGVDIDMWPIPTASDFRANLGAAEIENLQKANEERTNQIIHDAMAGVWKGIHSAVERLVERIKQFDPDQEGNKNITQPLIDAVNDQLDMIPLINITGDPALDKFAEAIRADITICDAATLREIPGARNEVVKRADQIMSKMEEFFR